MFNLRIRTSRERERSFLGGTKSSEIASCLELRQRPLSYHPLNQTGRIVFQDLGQAQNRLSRFC